MTASASRSACRHVAEEEVVSRNLAGRPPRQPLHVAQVGQRRALQLLHPRRIESRHLEPVAAGPLVAGDEEHLHLVARMYAQQARRACGEQQLLRTQRIAYARQPPFGEPAGEKRPVVGAVHPFERHALHGIARAHDPALDGIGRRPLHAVDGAQQRFEPSSRRDGPRLRGVDPGAVDHLDRRRKPTMRAVTSRLKPRITASATSITATDTATETTAMRDITPGRFSGEVRAVRRAMKNSRFKRQRS